MLADDSTAPAARAASTDSVGSTHSDPRTYSRSSSRPTVLTSATWFSTAPGPTRRASSTKTHANRFQGLQDHGLALIRSVDGSGPRRIMSRRARLQQRQHPFTEHAVCLSPG